jgi:dTDP-4-amino-4,6-dideoxygalactose transaminase
VILMNDFTAEPDTLRNAMLTAVDRVIRSGWYILGSEVTHFEQIWATHCGVAHGVGVGNGMDAIEIGLRALDIGPGHEVITTSMTAFATVLAVLRAGATPVLADIDPATALLNIDSVRRCITPATRAVLLVHIYGQIADMTGWQALCAEHGIELIEDAAQAHLASWSGRNAGSWGRFGAFSFYPTKNLGAIGDGGMLITNDAKLAERASMIRNYGQRVRYYHDEPGLNSRLDEVQAAILTERLQWLDYFTTRRRNIAQRYYTEIRNPAITVLAPPAYPAAHVHHLFVVRSAQREALMEHMNGHGIQTHIHYPVPVHLQTPCTHLRRAPSGLDACEAHAASCVSLPCHPFLDENAVNRVISAVNLFSPTP